MKSIITNDEYTALAEEIQSGFTERIHVAREEVILAHHEAGKAMSEFLKEHTELNKSLLVRRMAELGAAQETTLYLSLECYTKWPKYNDMIEATGAGKNASWNKVRAQLQAPKEKEEKQDVCKVCHLHCPPPHKSLMQGKI